MTRLPWAVGLASFASLFATLAHAGCAVPNTLTNGQIADANQVMANINAVANCADAKTPSGAANSVQINNGSGGFGNVGPLANGQLLIGSSGAAPQAATLTAGSGISITNYPGVISISSSASASGNSLITYQPPTSTLFTLTNLGSGVAISSHFGPKVLSVARTDGGSGNDVLGFLGKQVPSGSSWSSTIGMWTSPFGTGGNYYRSGLVIVENSTGRWIGLYYNTQGGNPGLSLFFGNNLSSFGGGLGGSANMAGGRFPVSFKVIFDGANYQFYYSLDFGDSWTAVGGLLPATTYFSSAADRVGIGLESYNGVNPGDLRADVYYYSDPDAP